MEDHQKNVVFIVIDTHRRDRLGIYGNGRNITPNQDDFAERATIFENAVSPAQWTIPAHASMFTGEYVNTHLTTQPGHSLDRYYRTIAEILGERGYQCIGFCNNPLVGVLDNELKRGFDTLYNYGGAIPSTPARDSGKLLKPLSQIWERYTQLLRRISYPIQNAFAQSDRMFQLSLRSIFVPMWTRFANFKGDTAKSLQDAGAYINHRFSQEDHKPQFIFINLMETHLPFTPPDQFVRQFVPYFTEERAARDFMRIYNTQALRWLLPMDEPFSEIESRTLSDFYDAEAAYQDYLLEDLLSQLNSPYHQENTMVILVSDHGEMLGEHDLMGHSFRVYQELVHVPLVVRYPGQLHGSRINQAVSTMQLFHTVMDMAGVILDDDPNDVLDGFEKRLERLSLMKYQQSGSEPEKTVFSEAHPPMNVLKILDANFPELKHAFNCYSIYRAAYDQDGYKLIRAEGAPDELYNLLQDDGESEPLQNNEGNERLNYLQTSLERFVEQTCTRRPEHWTRKDVDLSDEKVAKRLRALGYID